MLLLMAAGGVPAALSLALPGVLLGAAVWFVLPESTTPATVETVRDGLRLLRGPVGGLALAASLTAFAATTFASGIPLWLVQRGHAGDAAVVGVTLGAFNVAAAAGGVAAGWAAQRTRGSWLVPATLVAAVVPYTGLLLLEPGSGSFLALVVAAGALGNAAVPVLLVAAQDAARGRVAAASGLVMGFANGVAGIAFIGIGAIADLASLPLALALGMASVVPAGALTWRLLRDGSISVTAIRAPALACSCTPPVIDHTTHAATAARPSQSTPPLASSLAAARGGGT